MTEFSNYFRLYGCWGSVLHCRYYSCF